MMKQNVTMMEAVVIIGGPGNGRWVHVRNNASADPFMKEWQRQRREDAAAARLREVRWKRFLTRLRHLFFRHRT